MNSKPMKLVAMLNVALIAIASVLISIGCGGSKETVATEQPAPPPVVEEPAPPPPAPKPEPAPAPAKEPAKKPLELQTVHFEFDEYDLTPQARDKLARNARSLRDWPDAKVEIQGHCDERGTIEYNLALGEKRARSVMNYLVSLGVNRNQLTIISYGKERPVAYGHNEEAWAKNRRAEFVIR